MVGRALKINMKEIFECAWYNKTSNKAQMNSSNVGSHSYDQHLEVWFIATTYLF